MRSSHLAKRSTGEQADLHRLKVTGARNAQSGVNGLGCRGYPRPARREFEYFPTTRSHCATAATDSPGRPPARHRGTLRVRNWPIRSPLDHIRKGRPRAPIPFYHLKASQTMNNPRAWVRFTALRGWQSRSRPGRRRARPRRRRVKRGCPGLQTHR